MGVGMDGVYTSYAEWGPGWIERDARVRVLLHARRTSTGTKNGRITVEKYDYLLEQWVVPFGWDNEIELQASEYFLWGELPQCFYSQLARFLEVELYITGLIPAAWQREIQKMSAEDMTATSKAFEPLARNPFPKESASL